MTVHDLIKAVGFIAHSSTRTKYENRLFDDLFIIQDKHSKCADVIDCQGLEITMTGELAFPIPPLPTTKSFSTFPHFFMHVVAGRRRRYSFPA